MITKQDLQEAIAELQGHRNPTAFDCIKLAAYYIILNNLADVTDDEIRGASATSLYSRSEPPSSLETVNYTFTNQALNNGLQGRPTAYICELLDDIMNAIKVTNPELYNLAVRKMQK